jgi:hypothetical protein
VQGVDGVWALNVTDVALALYASDEPDAAVVEAAREAGLKLVVTDPALMREMPKIAVAAVEVKVADAMLRVAREVRDGRFVGKPYSFDLGSGILEVSLNQDLDPEAVAAATDALEGARAEVTAGLVEFDRLGL